MKEALFSLGILFLVPLNASALSYGTHEGGFANRVAAHAESFMELNEGRTPTSWEDLQIKDEEFDYINPSKRYAFVSTPIDLPAPRQGEMLLLTRRPFREQRLYTSWYGAIRHGLREPGRYIIYRTTGTTFRASYVSEQYVQKVFKGREDLLPQPDSEPERPTERKARVVRKTKIIALGGVAFISFLFTLPFIARCFSR